MRRRDDFGDDYETITVGDCDYNGVPAAVIDNSWEDYQYKETRLAV